MNFHFPPAGLLLPRLLVAGVLLSCFSIVLGAGNLIRPVKQQLAESDSAPVVTSTPVVQPPSIEDGNTGLSWFAAALVAVPQQIGDAPARPASFDQDGESQTAMQQDTMVGIWAPDASSCSLQNFKDGLLPTVINRDGASAGDTFCGFSNQRQTETGWRMDALCSNKQERWTTHVHLIVKGDRLIWKSKRGSQTYTRCMKDLRVAESR